MASLIRGVEDLVVEDREVKGKTQTDRVSRRQVGLGDLGSGLVCLERFISRLLAPVSNGELGKIAVVITLPTGQSETKPRRTTKNIGAGTDILW